MTNDQITRIIEKGAKRWTKSDKDRLYIDLDVAESAWETCREGCLPMNRRERQNAKFYIDILTDEVVVTGVGIYAEEIRSFLADYFVEDCKKAMEAEESRLVKFFTADREAGNIIDEFTSLDEAREAIKEYEETDRLNDEYTENFYSIIDEDRCTIE